MVVGGWYALADWWLRNARPTDELISIMLSFMWLGLGRMQRGRALEPLTRSAGTLAGAEARMTDALQVRVLGIDPGTASTGYGVVGRGGSRLEAVCGGVITTEAGQPLERRLAAISAQIGELLDEHHPDGARGRGHLLRAQRPHRIRGRTGARRRARRRGRCATCPVSPTRPRRSSSPSAARGRRRKDQVQRMVAALLGLDGPPEPDHAADALARRDLPREPAASPARPGDGGRSEGIRLTSRIER